MEVSCENQIVTVSGNNEEGYRYHEDNYHGKGLSHYMLYFDRHFSTPPYHFDSIYYYLQHELLIPSHTSLKKLEESGAISPKFSLMLYKNLYHRYSGRLLNIYAQWLYSRRGSYFKDYQPSDEDILIMLQHVNLLYDNTYGMSDDVKKLPEANIYFYILPFQYLDDNSKEMLLKGYDIACFGMNPCYLLAPDSLQLRFYGNSLVEEVQRAEPFYHYDQEKLLAYLSNKFPESEYVALIRELMAQKQSLKNSEK